MTKESPRKGRAPRATAPSKRRASARAATGARAPGATAAGAAADEQADADGDERAPVGRWGEREAGILAVALELFRKEGYEKTSMASVAAAAGLSEGTLYNYFRDKTDLVVRVMLVSLELRVAAAIRAVDEAGSLAEGLRNLIALHLAAIMEHEETYRIWVREVRAAHGFRRSAGRDALARFANQFLRLLDRFGHREKHYGGVSRAMMREMIFGGSEHIGFTAMLQRRASAVNIEETARALADVYLRGFGLNADPRDNGAGAQTRRPGGR